MHCYLQGKSLELTAVPACRPPILQAFYDAAAPGSWLVRLPGVSHVQFCDAGLVGNWWLDRLDRFPEWMR